VNNVLFLTLFFASFMVVVWNLKLVLRLREVHPGVFDGLGDRAHFILLEFNGRIT
jgi:hypothetical protein